MNKKDRVAVVITFIFLSIGVFGAAGGKAGVLIATGTPVMLYWGYRFIKNDISFFKVKDD